MRLTTLINIIITAVLIILGSILGGSYTNKLHLFWLSILIIYAVFIQFLYNIILTQNIELKAERDKVSAFFLRRNSKDQSYMQCSLFPKNYGSRIVKNRLIAMEIYVTSTIPLQKVPDIKISVDKDCRVFINNQNVNSTIFAGERNYYLQNSLVSNLENKYFKYSFDMEFINVGDYIINLEANNGDTVLTVSNSINILSN
ncbi:hypothetical protein LC085_21505 [Bacillus tianshenii]|uniref:hypothetical protein n=1 Tax=Sutcliffiella tianshenii TaxID=1463404 RepID=UPI001CD70699|nr:hypothetical protein [Bacillus tianshenii]MCA1322456.1 hypothetical protein [Bacillus tianshenii]